MIDCAVIIAVGSPTHTSRLTYNRPRAMLPALGKPLVVRTMDRLFRAGIQNYVVVVGEDEGAVAAYLNTQWLPNVNIEFSLQSSSSSLARTLADIARRREQPFIVTTYGSFVHANFPERLLKQNRDFEDALILAGAPTSLSKAPPPAYAAVEGDQIRYISREKAENGLLLMNLAVCGQRVIEFLKGLVMNTGTFSKQLLDLLQLYVQSGGAAQIAETAWSLQLEADYDLLTVNKLLLDDEQDTHILSDLPGTVQIIPPVRIDPQVSIGQGAKIGPRVYLEAGCSIGHHATVSNAIILQNAVIPARSTIHDCIISTRARINNPDQG